MINAIVFSKDRALQLNLLLESLELNAKDCFKLTILYKASNDNFKLSYDVLKNYWKDISFIEEKSFKDDLNGLINQNFNKWTTFFVDDNILFKPINLDLLNDIGDDVLTFSLRLGTNITWCYSMKQPNELKEFGCFNDKIVWNYRNHKNDFGYPYSVDGHIFRTNEVYIMTKWGQYNNPNTLEASVQSMMNTTPLNKMMSFEKSVLINNPVNMVQTVFTNNNVSNNIEYNTEKLNNLFLEGKRIDINSIDFGNITAPHQELQFIYK